MARSRLSTRFTLYSWNKFSKEFKKEYKEENEKPLDTNTALHITFDRLKKSMFGGFKEPDIEDVVRLIKLGNKNVNEEQAVEILENYLVDETTANMGMTGAFIDIVIDFYSDLNISPKLTAKAKEIKTLYVKSLEEEKETVEAETVETNEDTVVTAE